MAPPSTDWKETIPAGEAAVFEGYAGALREMQRRAAVGGKPARALHAKGWAATAEFTVLPDLPPYARHGLFAAPATYGAYVRYSNGAGARQADGKGDVRGVAIKVVGVEGKKVIAGMENARTQDFLLIRTPALPFRDAHEFVKVVTAATNPLLLLPRVIGRLGVGRTLGLLPKLARSIASPALSVATAGYFSAAAIRCGDHAVRYSLVPQATDAPAKPGTSSDYLREELAARLKRGPVVYDMRLQFYVDAVKTPIEDFSVEWLEADAPPVTVARLTLSRQDTASTRGQRIAEYVESLSFDPWHALEAHRPLGNIMRARNHAYRLSTIERGAIAEPDGSERFEAP
jgi:catalase